MKDLFERLIGFIKKMLAEHPEVSNVRVLATLCIVAAIALVYSSFVYFMFTGKLFSDGLAYVGMLLGSGFGGKVVSKFGEGKSEVDAEEKK
jgi:hypothetical protein